MGDDHNGVENRDVFMDDEEGQQYRSSSYMPTAYDNLDVAPESDAYPDRGTEDKEEGGGYRVLDLPRAPKLRHVIGPSAIMLGASLGSGETLFWPVLIARNGWGIYWMFFVGVLLQFFINTEIQRWTIATGESIFRGFERIAQGWPLLFLLLGLVSLGWPGWAATAADVGAIGLGIQSLSIDVFGVTLVAWKLIGIGLMVLIWLSYQLTPLMYNVIERMQMLLVAIAVAAVIVLFLLIGNPDELLKIPGGLVNIGRVPKNSDFALLLGGLAYAGAGGYLNLSESLWVREKGYGMGRYQGRVKNPLLGDDPEPVQQDGFTFPPTPVNLNRWRAWWRLVQLEHLVTFVGGLLLVATLMMAIAAEFAQQTTVEGILMWSEVIVPQVDRVSAALIFGTLFLSLLTTEYGIVESFVRNSADIIYEAHGREANWSLPRIFWSLLTGFVLWGIVILSLPIPIKQPFGLLVVSASMSGVMMWPYTALLAVLNTTRMPEHTQPGWLRLASLWCGSAFFGYFSVLLIGDWIVTSLGIEQFSTSIDVVSSDPGGYLLFGVLISLQLVMMAVSTVGKLRALDTIEDVESARGLLF